jgi:hypothetical protein
MVPSTGIEVNMENKIIDTKITAEVVNQFEFNGEFIHIEPLGQGHINSTYAVYFRRETVPPIRYVLQRINTSILKNPLALMKNIEGVTNHLRKKIMEAGGNPDRETLTIVKTKDGKLFYEDGDKECWRAYLFIEDATCYQSAEKPGLFYNSAKAFGRFQKLLSDYPAETLSETIEKFHNTVNRYKNFEKAVQEDRMGRAKDVQKEIEFVKARKDDCGIVLDLIEKKEIPLRVTHNDTKLNNIMMDNETNEGICVIDLDTVMPGSVFYDFGDSIRFGASSAAEDETDLSKVYMDINLFKEYVEGFLSEAGETLTKKEYELLAFSAKLLTLECGIRFLTDYLEGDTYFKIHREHHNLDRARTQFKLVADMEEKMEMMNEIVMSHCKN